MKRIAIIGNGGGGKTTLSRSLAAKFGFPLTHVDTIQFLPGMKTRAVAETSEILNRLAEGDSWLIDGFGAWEVMERRFRLADRVVFVDFPLWRHYWWCTKRQVCSLRTPRSELPAGCNEATLKHTFELFQILWRVHIRIRPKLMELFERPEMKSKVTRIRSMKDWNRVYSGSV